MLSLMRNIYHKVYLHPLLYFFMLLATLTAHFQEFCTFMLIIFVHECGHLLFAFLFQWKIERVLFLPFGGMIQFKERLNKPIYQEFFILIGGPLFQIIFYQIYPTIYHYPLLIFNLLPIYPLDGSKFLFLFCNLFMSYYKCYWMLFISSYITVIFLLLSYPSLYAVIFGCYLLFQNIDMIKDLSNIFLKFLFERYEQEFFYYRKKLIKQNNVKKMMRDVNTIFFYNDTFYAEREVLKRYFLNKK